MAEDADTAEVEGGIAVGELLQDRNVVADTAIGGLRWLKSLKAFARPGMPRPSIMTTTKPSSASACACQKPRPRPDRVGPPNGAESANEVGTWLTCGPP